MKRWWLLMVCLWVPALMAAAEIDGTYGMQTGYGGEAIRLEGGQATLATYSDVGGGTGKTPVKGRYRVNGNVIELEFPGMAPRRLVHEITPSAEYLFSATSTSSYRLKKFTAKSMADVWNGCPFSKEIEKTAPPVVFSSASEPVRRPLADLTAERKEIESRAAKRPDDAALQQGLANARKAESDESERLYTEGLIAYSEGRRDEAMQKWKALLSARPDHRCRLMKNAVEAEAAAAPARNGPP